MADSDITGSDQTGANQINYQNIVAEQRAAWQHILILSGQMLELAAQCDWESLDTLQQQREQLLEAFFRLSLAQDLVHEVQSGIIIIKNSDQKIVRLVQNNREELGQEVKKLQSMKERVKAYTSADEK